MHSNSTGDPLLDTLGAALAQATTNDDRVKVHLAIELRKHLLSDQAKFLERHQALRSKYTRAQEAHKHSTESVERDGARLAGLLQHGNSGGIQTLIKHSLTKDKQRARESLEFSQMMANGTRRDVDQALADLMACEQEHEASIRRLRTETQLACMACRSLLERTNFWHNNVDDVVTETISIVEIEDYDSSSTRRSALLAPPPPPPISSPPVPPPPPPPVPPPPSPRSPLTPVYQQSDAVDLPRPRLRPPLPTQPKPLNALAWRPAAAARPPSIPSTRRPFTITCESTQHARHQFQQSIPQQYLVAGSVIKGGVGEAINQQIRRMLFGQLWTCVRGVLDSQRISAELQEGVAGFGADAYISVSAVSATSAGKLVRMPIAIVDTFGAALSSAEQLSPVSVNHRAVAMCIVEYAKHTSHWICDYRAVESAIRRLVLLISTEPLACGTGVLVAAEGVLLVRRTGQMAVSVSELYFYQQVATNCHPVAAIGHFVCTVSQQAAASNVPLFEPPVFL
ncbi:hypothetical protein IWW38_003569 [Coemansia aciculifera]|uniref:Uncharacterized protein n=1 Tax=Coemansia aciculifera TaxID=417176 RepID=A0ACC1M0Y2_9FUNG|nr:hypothetical protein IWW38_003569 [Coemansia aciculifera]